MRTLKTITQQILWILMASFLVVSAGCYIPTEAELPSPIEEPPQEWTEPQIAEETFRCPAQGGSYYCSEYPIRVSVESGLVWDYPSKYVKFGSNAKDSFVILRSLEGTETLKLSIDSLGLRVIRYFQVPPIEDSIINSNGDL